MLSRCIIDTIHFIVSIGVIDQAAEVRKAMIDAGRNIIDQYCKPSTTSTLLSILHDILEAKPKPGDDLVAFDYRYEAAVIFMGTAGKHLLKGSASGDIAPVVGIIDILIKALKIPSEVIQITISDCLVQLVSVIKGNNEKAIEIVDRLSNICLNSVGDT